MYLRRSGTAGSSAGAGPRGAPISWAGEDLSEPQQSTCVNAPGFLMLQRTWTLTITAARGSLV
jgi:hypothetical protein